MPYLLTSEGCYCQRFVFREQKGELIGREKGKIYSGSLALQIFNDRDDLRITLVDAANIGTAVLKRAFLPGFLAGDPLCHFDFTEAELNVGKKKIRIEERQYNNELAYLLFCYDFSTWEGRMYLFRKKEEVKKWARTIGIDKLEKRVGEKIVSTERI